MMDEKNWDLVVGSCVVLISITQYLRSDRERERERERERDVYGGWGKQEDSNKRRLWKGVGCETVVVVLVGVVATLIFLVGLDDLQRLQSNSCQCGPVGVYARASPSSPIWFFWNDPDIHII
jgi:hypothetical protein